MMAASAERRAEPCPSSAIELVEACGAGLRDAVFRFRYDVYVREMRRPQKDADHARGRIEDALDARALLFAAREPASGRIVGTVRANVAADGGLGLYEDLYGLATLTADERAVTSITTRLMIDRRCRRTALGVRLATALYARGLERGITTDFIDCNEHLIAFFEHLGYRKVRVIRHPDYGHVMLMRLDVHDVQHFERVGSPFAADHAIRSGRRLRAGLTRV
jgi:GNAT superfamily N-acetyltransferase